MSYTTPPPPPSGASAPAARPGTVSLATTLLYLLTLLSVISVVLAIYQATFYDKAKIQQIYEDAGMDRATAEGAAVGASVGVYFAAAFALLIAAGYLISAIFVGKGKQWARILTWVWAGLFGVCCGIAGLAGQAATGMLSGMGNTGGIDQAKVQQDIMDLIPGWLNTVTIVLGVISLLSAIAVIILLALPPSNPYFRKQEAQWTPPPYPAP
jgi:hypothetical protein